MVRQKDEEYFWLGSNRHRYNARVLRFPRIFLFLFVNGSTTNIGAHRSPGRDAPSLASIGHRCLRDTFECLLLYPDWGIHVQSRHLLARHKEW